MKYAVQTYYRYWGKTSGEKKPQEAACHLLPYHCLDVAAAGKYLLEHDLARANTLAEALGVSREELISLVTYSLAIHDLGKFARAFQGLALMPDLDLVRPDPRMSYDKRHDELGALLWSEFLSPRLQKAGGCGFPDSTSFKLPMRTSLELWLGCFFGHHGHPVRSPEKRMENWFKLDDMEAAWQFAQDAAQLLSPSWPLDLLANKKWRDGILRLQTWQIAGLVILADWLGSNRAGLGFLDHPISLEDYWQDVAWPGAEQVVERSGLIERKQAASFPGFKSLFEFDPTPLQTWAESVVLGNGPQLFLLEDITGSGKTEAALTLAQRLMATGLADGFYFGLPTMATSNAMYSRIGQIYHSFFSKGTNPSLILAHAARELHQGFVRSILEEPNYGQAYDFNEPSAEAQCREWLADNRKKALLADVGVGTVDQALLGVLPLQHQSLRLLGLMRKVLIVDEVHAYDTYTGTLLMRLLEAHARQGGSAVLLSATLPHELRRQLVNAWRRGTDLEEGHTLDQAAFPLATQVTENHVREHPVQACDFSKRNLDVSFIFSQEEVLNVVQEAVQAGKCVCWIRNTVDDAIHSYNLLQEINYGAEEIILFHARFVMGDRQRIENTALDRFGKESHSAKRRGRVLIATQVVEQSLDVDFDVMISDLAPVDLLIQRAGRLHRHSRDEYGNPIGRQDRRDEREAPVLRIFAPEWKQVPESDWLKNALPGTSFVYRDAGRMWLTCKILRELKGINLPLQARDLLEGVYGGESQIPEGLEVVSWEYFSDQMAKSSMAEFNVLDLSRGYSVESSQGEWIRDQDIGTRLSEPTVEVVLLRETGEGKLCPWIEDVSHPWAMSTVTLRQSQVKHLPPEPEHLETALQELRERHGFLKFVRFWMPEQISDSRAEYDTALGVVLPRKGGEQK